LLELLNTKSSDLTDTIAVNMDLNSLLFFHLRPALFKFFLHVSPDVERFFSKLIYLIFGTFLKLIKTVFSLNNRCPLHEMLQLVIRGVSFVTSPPSLDFSTGKNGSISTQKLLTRIIKDCSHRWKVCKA
jgi:hypothetical protein